jgi:hypothetical protein
LCGTCCTRARACPIVSHGRIHHVRRRRPAAGCALVLLPGRVLQLPARRRGAIAQSIKVLTTWYALSPLSISTWCPDLSSLPDGICICPPSSARANDTLRMVSHRGAMRLVLVSTGDPTPSPRRPPRVAYPPTSVSAPRPTPSTIPPAGRHGKCAAHTP